MAKAWAPLDLATLPNYRVIACDPSLTACGLVFLEVHDGEAYVLGAEKLTEPPSELEGWEDTFERTERIEKQIRATLDDWVFGYGDTYLQAVHESPPIGGGPLVRTEVSTLVGYAFRTQADEVGIDVGTLVMPQAHKKLTCGNGRAKKIEHHAAIKQMLPDIIGGKLVTNEATRDALSIGLYAAWREGL